jgi:GMP reductase
MRIENELLLDYSDVLIRPKRSTLGSRKEVNLEREFTFRNYKTEQDVMTGEHDWSGTPFMASNMDGVGTFEIADKLAEGDIFTCLGKTYSLEELVSYFDVTFPERTANVAMSIGTSKEDFAKLSAVIGAVSTRLKYV